MNNKINTNNNNYKYTYTTRNLDSAFYHILDLLSLTRYIIISCLFYIILIILITY